VLLKRGIHMGSVQEFISAAEYIVQLGNPNVILCPRGTQPALDGYRNTGREHRPSRERTHVGRRWSSIPRTRSERPRMSARPPLPPSLYGADGLCIECNVHPNKGIGDDPKQAVAPEMLQADISQSRELWRIRRSPPE